MAIGVVGKKCGMTRLFTEAGISIPVTVIEVEANKITQIKLPKKEGYSAVQITTGSKKANRVTKPLAGHFAKANVSAGRGLWEFRVTEQQANDFKLGDELTVSQFTPGQIVDVSGTSIGKGFAGVIKRWNFASQDATHGNSLSHRAPGSIGQNQSPGRVFKGKKMAGHLGNEKVTTHALEVVRVDVEKNLLLIKGAVPGAKNGDVIIYPSVKAR